MTNADVFVKDLDRLAGLIERADDFDMDLGICTLRADEVTGEFTGCRYEDKNENCVQCIREWLEREAN